MKLRTATITATVLLVGAFIGKRLVQREITVPPTYYEYSVDEVRSVAARKSKAGMTREELYSWDQTAFDLVAENKIGDADASRIYAYLTTGQADAAALSRAATGGYAGSLAPVSRGILCLFSPRDCAKDSTGSDAYSEHLAAIVIEKTRARIQADERGTAAYERKNDAQWNGYLPHYGRSSGSWLPWGIGSPSGFQAPPPVEGAAMKRQLERVREARRQATPSQRKAVVLWAGGPGTKTPPGQWLEIADDALQSRDASLEDVLRIRAVLSRTIADAAIVAFHNKYTYWKKRPFMLDASMRTIMPTPNHPSYPAGHGTISGAAAVILAYHLPDHAEEFEAKAREACDSRLWGGIHFPEDNEQGFLLGRRVAEDVLKGSTPVRGRR